MPCIKVEKFCQFCGIKFDGRKDAKFCCKACANKAWYYSKIKTIKYCPKCGKEIKDGRNKYCSSACEVQAYIVKHPSKKKLSKLELDCIEMKVLGYGHGYGRYMADKKDGKLKKEENSGE